MPTEPSTAPAQSRAPVEGDAWRSFLAALTALSVALGLALYSGAAAETGSLRSAAAAGLGALALAGWTGITTVPSLTRRTRLGWLASSHTDFRVTRAGIIYLAGVFAVALAALNTGNNLLFLMLGCMLAVILLSGILSRITLTGIEARLELPEHVFAQTPAPATLALHNAKQTLPSFSLRVLGASETVANKRGLSGGATELPSRPREVRLPPVYFPYLARGQAFEQPVELTFPLRGLYRQEALAVQSRFPFGFLEKTRNLPCQEQILVYPAISPTEYFYEVLPLISGELESFVRGRGHDLYAIRELAPGDGARFVDWKATARSGSMKVREFAREDERRVLLALDPFGACDASGGRASPEKSAQQFERAVTLCACLAWHFQELDALLGFRCGESEVPLAPAGDNIFAVLRALALTNPAMPADPRAGRDFLQHLGRESDVFKIVFTSQPRGTIPTSLWTSSYLLFLDSL
jgi:uncharacterized protein (DUF58 family)